MTEGGPTVDIMATESRITTGSRGTRLLGLAALAGGLALLVFAFVLTAPDVRTHPISGEEFGQFDAGRLLYLHVPMAVLMYVSYLLCAVASVGVLVKRTPWWDVMAHSAAEVGTVLCGLVLVLSLIHI